MSKAISQRGAGPGGQRNRPQTASPFFIHQDGRQVPFPSPHQGGHSRAYASTHRIAMWHLPLRMICSNGKFALVGGDDTSENGTRYAVRRSSSSCKWHKRYAVRQSSSSCHLYSPIDSLIMPLCVLFAGTSPFGELTTRNLRVGSIMVASCSPPEYPFKPPNFVFLTPSGRFEVGTKVCLSFSAHHLGTVASEFCLLNIYQYEITDITIQFTPL